MSTTPALRLHASGRGSAVVTGAASGIGRSIALRLAAAGVVVTTLDCDVAGNELLRDDLPRPHAVLDGDVADQADVRRAFATAGRDGGPPALVVSAAGVIRPAPLSRITAIDWAEHWSVNVTGVLHCLQASAEHLPAGGAVVVIGSNASTVPRIGMAGYAASKAAVAALTRCAGLELAAQGIRCNLVEPGSTDTPMQRTLWPDPEAGRVTALHGDPANYRVGIPLQRLADPDDVAEAVLFLLSDAARHITMQRLLVDGGATL